MHHVLAQEPDFVVAGEADDGPAAVALAVELNPDIVVLDLQLPGAEKPEVLRSLCRGDARWRSLVLARPEDTAEVAEAFREGARGVVHKSSAMTALIQGIRTVSAGRRWLGSEAASTRAGTNAGKGGVARPRGDNFGLTKREMEIVSAIVSGFSNKEIARRLRISEDTVKHHLTNVFDKVGAYNRLELALFAIHHGLVGRNLEDSKSRRH